MGGIDVLIHLARGCHPADRAGDVWIGDEGAQTELCGGQALAGHFGADLLARRRDHAAREGGHDHHSDPLAPQVVDHLLVAAIEHVLLEDDALPGVGIHKVTDPLRACVRGEPDGADQPLLTGLERRFECAVLQDVPVHLRRVGAPKVEDIEVVRLIPLERCL